jgi:hypothetical protein
MFVKLLSIFPVPMMQVLDIFAQTGTSHSYQPILQSKKLIQVRYCATYHLGHGKLERNIHHQLCACDPNQ